MYNWMYFAISLNNLSTHMLKSLSAIREYLSEEGHWIVIKPGLIQLE